MPRPDMQDADEVEGKQPERPTVEQNLDAKYDMHRQGQTLLR